MQGKRKVPSDEMILAEILAYFAFIGAVAVGATVAVSLL